MKPRGLTPRSNAHIPVLAFEFRTATSPSTKTSVTRAITTSHPTSSNRTMSICWSGLHCSTGWPGWDYSFWISLAAPSNQFPAWCYWMYQGRFHSKHVSCTAFQHSNQSLCGTDPPTSSSVHIQLWDIERQKQRTWSDIVDSLLLQTHPKPTKMSPRIICCNAWTWLSLVVKPISCFQQIRCRKFRKTLIQVINHQPGLVLLQNRFGIRPLHEFIIGAIKTPKVATKSGTQSWLVPHVGQLLRDHPANDLLEKLKLIGP